MKLLFIILSSIFIQGNEAYSNQDYERAITCYEQCLSDADSIAYADGDKLYYNLGNAYFKSNELGKSILCYERALRIKPNYKDAQHNLAFAQSRIIDNIEDHNSFFLRQWAISIRNWLPAHTWMWLSIVLFSLFLVGMLLFAFLGTAGGRKAGFHMAWVALLAAILCFVLAAASHHQSNRTDEAIIMQGIVNAKSSPDRSGTDLFVMHEGTKVVIKETIGEWVNVSVGDNLGWIQASALERI